jgi:hypothetical protein
MHAERAAIREINPGPGKEDARQQAGHETGMRRVRNHCPDGGMIRTPGSS